MGAPGAFTKDGDTYAFDPCGWETEPGHDGSSNVLTVAGWERTLTGRRKTGSARAHWATA